MHADDDDRQVETLFCAIDLPHGERICCSVCVCVFLVTSIHGWITGGDGEVKPLHSRSLHVDCLLAGGGDLDAKIRMRLFLIFKRVFPAI